MRISSELECERVSECIGYGANISIYFTIFDGNFLCMVCFFILRLESASSNCNGYFRSIQSNFIDRVQCTIFGSCFSCLVCSWCCCSDCYISLLCCNSMFLSNIFAVVFSLIPRVQVITNRMKRAAKGNEREKNNGRTNPAPKWFDFVVECMYYSEECSVSNYLVCLCVIFICRVRFEIQMCHLVSFIGELKRSVCVCIWNVNDWIGMSA